MNMQREPVAIIESLKTIVTLAVAWVVIMGIWQLTDQQQAVTVSLAIAVVNLVGSIWQRSRVTPVDGTNKGSPTSLD